MEKYIVLVLLSALGFISTITAKCLGDFPSKRGEFDSVMVYATYSLFSISLSFLMAYFCGMFSLSESWIDIENKFAVPVFTAKFLLLSIICSVFIGGGWQLYGRNVLVSFFNFINKRAGRNIVFLSGSLFGKMFYDGKDHFLVVEKDGQEIAVGFFLGLSSPKSERIELALSAYPEYKQCLDKVRKSNKDHPLKITKSVYFDVTNNLKVTELEFPPEWLTSPASLVGFEVEGV